MEVLQHLADKSKVAEVEGGRSPLSYKVDGGFMQMELIRTLQDRQRGAAVGFGELQRLLDDREVTLRDTIAQQKQAEEEQHGTNQQ